MEKIGEKTALFVVGFCIMLFAYFGYCGFKGEIPFNKDFKEEATNKSCGEQLQIKGYCCRSIEQFNSNDCTK